MQEEMIEFVYDAMQGNCSESMMPPGIKVAFAEGSLYEKLYEKVYDAERRLEERLGVNGHDEDVESIICAMEDIQKYLCFQMYAYGAKYGYNQDLLYADYDDGV